MNSIDNDYAIMDLSGWRTARLMFLLGDYEDALRSLEHFRRGEQNEIRLYRQWIKAITEELNRRANNWWLPELRLATDINPIPRLPLAWLMNRFIRLLLPATRLRLRATRKFR